jgi:hypothetical protein
LHFAGRSVRSVAVALAVAASFASAGNAAVLSDFVIDEDGNYVVPEGDSLYLQSAVVIPTGKQLILNGTLFTETNSANVSFGEGATLQIGPDGLVYLFKGSLTLPENSVFNHSQGSIHLSNNLSPSLHVPASSSLNLVGGHLRVDSDADVYLNGGTLVWHSKLELNSASVAPPAVIHGNVHVAGPNSGTRAGGEVHDNSLITGALKITGQAVFWNTYGATVHVNGDVLIENSEYEFDGAVIHSDTRITIRNSEVYNLGKFGGFKAPEIIFESDAVTRFGGTLSGNVLNSGDFSRTAHMGSSHIRVLGNFTQDQHGILRLTPEVGSDVDSAMIVDGILSLDGKLFIADHVKGAGAPANPFVYDMIVADDIILAPTLEMIFESGWDAYWGLVDLEDGREAFRVSFGMGPVQGAVDAAPIPVPLPPAMLMFPLAAGVALYVRRRLSRVNGSAF